MDSMDTEKGAHYFTETTGLRLEPRYFPGGGVDYTIVGLDAYQDHHGVPAACALEDAIMALIPIRDGRVNLADVEHVTEMLASDTLRRMI